LGVVVFSALKAQSANRIFHVKKFIQSWLINTLAVLVAVYVVKGIHYEKPLDLLVASLLLGILNAVLRPLLMLLTLPLLIFTLGLFTLVINACLLYFVGFLLRPYFFVDDFSSAFWGALIISIIGLILNTLTGTGSSRLRVQKGSPRQGSDRDSGSGPVIDV
jgi:putative membrane protein